jgi:hypothetical protein
MIRAAALRKNVAAVYDRRTCSEDGTSIAKKPSAVIDTPLQGWNLEFEP